MSTKPATITAAHIAAAEEQIALCNDEHWTAAHLAGRIAEAEALAVANGPHGIRVAHCHAAISRALQGLGLRAECGVLYAPGF